MKKKELEKLKKEKEKLSEEMVKLLDKSNRYKTKADLIYFEIQDIHKKINYHCLGE